MFAGKVASYPSGTRWVLLLTGQALGSGCRPNPKMSDEDGIVKHSSLLLSDRKLHLRRAIWDLAERSIFSKHSFSFYRKLEKNKNLFQTNGILRL